MGPKVGLNGALGNHQCEANSVGQVNGVLDTLLPACSVMGGLVMGTMDCAGTSVWEKATPPALTLLSDN